MTNSKTKSYVVSVTQCSTCGTLSVHWGLELDDTCTLCSETTILINNFLNPENPIDTQTFPIDPNSPMGESMELGMRQDEIDYYSGGSGEFTGGLNDLLNALERTSSNSSQVRSIESITDRSLEELDSLVPLLGSIRESVEADWTTLQEALEKVNDYLKTPESHWRWETGLEIHRDQVMAPLARLNTFIDEAKQLGLDLVDCSEVTFCALSRLPEWYFVGKEELGEDTHAFFYYDGTEDKFNSFSQLTMNHHSRSKLNKDN